jgi:hypothetical protein
MRLSSKSSGRPRRVRVDPTTGEPIDRRHYLASGDPKHPFRTQAEAWVAARRLLGRKALGLARIDVYQCPVCNQFHVGNKHGSFVDPRKHFFYNLAHEIGDRAAACMLGENYGPASTRLGVVLERFEAAERRRTRDLPTPPRPGRFLP